MDVICLHFLSEKKREVDLTDLLHFFCHLILLLSELDGDLQLTLPKDVTNRINRLKG